MTVEHVSEQPFTSSQIENQRLFKVGPSAHESEQPGDKGKRIRNKALIFTAATAADLGESWIAESLLEKLGERMVDKAAVAEKDQKALNNKALFFGIGFVEDGISDELYAVGMNSVLRGMTGVEEAAYATPTAKFIEGWTNLGTFASGKFQDTVNQHGEVIEEKKLKVWQKPWNVVNAVNAEAFIGLLEELPIGIGKTVEKMHASFDKVLTESEAVQLTNGVAKMLVTGYHIARNMVHDSRPVMTTE